MSSVTKRRSIRKYQPCPVEPELVERLLAAAMCAPSAHDRRTWAFVVIDDRKLLDSIPSFHPYSSMLPQTPVAILVCGQIENEGRDHDFWVQNCAAATENILIEATEAGLGSCWLGVYPKEPIMQGFRKLLNLPEEKVIPFALVTLGYPAETKEPAKRFDPTRVHRNGW